VAQLDRIMNIMKISMIEALQRPHEYESP